MTHTLTELESKAAQLASRGFTESQIASACGKSRSWVQRLKRREDFQKLASQQPKLQILPLPVNQTQPERQSEPETDIEKLFNSALRKISKILDDEESRPRDVLAAIRLILDLKRSHFAWVNVDALKSLEVLELSRTALRQIMLTSINPANVQQSAKELYKMPPPVEKRTSRKDRVEDLSRLSDEEINRRFKEMTGF
ncbi:MAG: helix-turn-helix domain containing protein [Rhizonema sp. NSF051]|nr:helix-turn-helix domain containing protein [Rhizonema sp. NSF051]